jgi:protein-L-isoaspartate(D-aspartate) O-methyltransferase
MRILNQKRRFVYIFKGISLFVVFFFLSIPPKYALADHSFEMLRNTMVEEQLKRRNIQSDAVLDAMRAVPRHLFVPKNLQRYAYNDSPLPIGLGQTISQPYIVAFMTEQLDPAPGMKILEIGTGSGYQAAILAHLGCTVYTIELLEELAARAEKILSELNFNTVKIKCGNGYSGWPEAAPFDAVIVTAAPDKIPAKLVEQLKEGGRLIVPVGPINSQQSLRLITKKDTGILEKDLLPVMFVPMVE